MRADLTAGVGYAASCEGVEWWNRAGSRCSSELWRKGATRSGGDQGTRRCRSSNGLRINFPSSR